MREPTDEAGPPAPEERSPAEPVRVPRPWWLPHFLGRVPLGLEKHHVSLVGVVALAGFFENYDLSMLSAALKQIRESFGLDQAEMTSLVAWVRLGALPAFLVMPLADRIGRRVVFLWSIFGMSLGTFLTGFAQTPLQFVTLQLGTRAFVVGSIATAVVIIAEELPAEHRGWGVGMLGAIGAFGYGLGALLYAFVESLPFGWRSLYFVGLLPILLLPMMQRRVPETRRFQSLREGHGEEPAGWARPLLELLRTHPLRSLGVGAMALLVAAGVSPAFGLLSDFVQSTHGWPPSRYSLMAIVAGLFGIVGNSAMGWAADRIGRRPAASIAFGFFPLVAFAIYQGPSVGIAFFWIPMVFLLTGGNVLMRVVTTELFPTSSRNTAMGWETLLETLGASVGFVLVAMVTAQDASIAPAVVLVSGLTILGAAVVWTFPETAGRELEATSEGGASHAG